MCALLNHSSYKKYILKCFSNKVQPQCFTPQLEKVELLLWFINLETCITGGTWAHCGGNHKNAKMKTK